MLLFLLSLVSDWRTVMFQLSGFDCKDNPHMLPLPRYHELGLPL